MPTARFDRLVDWLITSLCNPALQALQQANLPGSIPMTAYTGYTGFTGYAGAWGSASVPAKATRGVDLLAAQGGQA